MERIGNLTSEPGIVIFSKSTCCLGYTVEILIKELGVNPTVHEIDSFPDGKVIEKALSKMNSGSPVPAVFIDGKFIGSTNEVISLHLSGELIPLLRPHQHHDLP